MADLVFLWIQVDEDFLKRKERGQKGARTFVRKKQDIGLKMKIQVAQP